MGMFSQEESVKESIDEQVDDLSDLDELDEEIPEVEVESEDEDVDEPVFGPVIVDDDGDPIDEPEPADDFEPAYEDVEEEYEKLLAEDNDAESAREETKKQYEEIMCCREDTERIMADTRKDIAMTDADYTSDFNLDNAFRIRVAKSAEHLGEAYAEHARHYIELLKCEEFLRFALSTSVFEDGDIGYIVNDHITLSLKLERS